MRGYDYSRGLVALGKSKGIDLVCGGLYDITGTYNIIVANHVVEHFTEFLSDVVKLRSHLVSDGLMYVGVPNVERLSMAHLQNAHTYYFSLKTLRHYMAQCGFRMVHSQPESLGDHMSCIFVADSSQNDNGSLNGHYEEMVRILWRRAYLYGPIRFVVNPIVRASIKAMELTGSKRTIKRVVRSIFSKKHDSHAAANDR